MPESWIDAGPIRAAVWDAPCDLIPAAPGDVEVVHFSPGAPCPAAADALEARLRALDHRAAIPSTAKAVDPPEGCPAKLGWGGAVVRPQPGPDARAQRPSALHRHGGRGVALDGNRDRRTRAGRIEPLAPHGLADPLGFVVRPGPAYAHRPEEVWRRVRDKGRVRRWPGLTPA